MQDLFCFPSYSPHIPQAAYVNKVGVHMAKKRSKELYKAARTMNDIETIASGNQKKILRRGKNKLLGRMLSKLKIWRYFFALRLVL
jgi:hypothetical protein